MTETTTVIARGIGKPDLRYEQFRYDQVQQVLMQMGIPPENSNVFTKPWKAVATFHLHPELQIDVVARLGRGANYSQSQHYE